MPTGPQHNRTTSIMSTLRGQRALYAPLLGIAAIGLVACSGKPENSPVIRKKFAEVDAMKEDLSTAVAELRSATGEITLLREQVSELRAFTPDGEGATAVLSRIEAIENRLTAISSNQAQSRTVAQANSGEQQQQERSTTSSSPSTSTSSEFGGLATPQTAAAAPATSSPANSFRTMTNPRAASTTTTSTSSAPARTETAAAPRTTTPTTTTSTNQSQANRGRYHTIETGDTLEKLARDNNISVEALREANRLPAGARPLRGQRLFIPPARQ